MSDTTSPQSNETTSEKHAPANPASEHPTDARGSTGGKVLLFISTAVLLSWFTWLSYTALTKSHEPVVSHAQAAATKFAVVATLSDGEADRESKLVRSGGIQGENATPLKAKAGKPAFTVTVKELLTANGPAKDTQIGVWNLPASVGYVGPGDYLLLLDKADDSTLDDHPAYFLVGQQRSPGADLELLGAPMIYKWGDDVRKQAKRMFP